MEKKSKSKTTLKEIKRKMKKMTLAEKKQVKEDIKQEKLKEKESKQKQKITQRVKININIPTQKAVSPQIQNPFSSSNRDQINLLTSINEQLKKKDEPKKITENFNIPVTGVATQTEPKKTATSLATQTAENFNNSATTQTAENLPKTAFNIPELIKPFRLKVVEPSDESTYNTPNSLSFFPNQHSDSSLASSNEENILDKIQKSVNEKVKNENIRKKDEALSIKKLDKLNETKGIFDETQQILENEKKIDEDMKKLGDAFNKSKLKDILINKVKEEVSSKNPIIDKPKDTSNLSLLEKVNEGSKESYFVPTQEEFDKDLNEVSKEFQKIYTEGTNEGYTEIDRGPQIIEDELQGFSPKVTNPLTPPPETSEESLLEKVKRGGGRTRMTDEERSQKEAERRQKAEELKNQTKLDNIQKALEIEAKRELERVQKDIEKINKKETNKQLISDKAFNVLLSETPEAEKGSIRRQYEVDDLSDAKIKKILKQRYGYTDEEVKRIFSLK